MTGDRYESRNGSPMRRMGDRLVDPVLATIVERHVPPRHRDKLLAFCESGFGWAQMKIVLGLMEVDVDGLLAEDVSGEHWDGDKAIIATAELQGHLRWRGKDGRISLPAPTPSETIRMGMVGRPLGELCQHPCLPDDLRIARIDRLAQVWEVTLDLPLER